MPVIERYATGEILVTCDATLPIDEVTALLFETVKEIIRNGQTA